VICQISQYIRGARIGEKALDLDENILQMLSEQFNIDSVDSLCESIDRIATSAECLIESLISGQGLQSGVYKHKLT
jgi:hypothetical protein